jgi:hypothetical protein
MSYQLSAISYQLSAITSGHQLSANTSKGVWFREQDNVFLDDHYYTVSNTAPSIYQDDVCRLEPNQPPPKHKEAQKGY